MREIERTTAFKRDYKRESKGRYRKVLSNLVTEVVSMLANDTTLCSRYRDHDLSGNWSGCRECHLKPDLLLISRAARPLPSGRGCKVHKTCELMLRYFFFFRQDILSA